MAGRVREIEMINKTSRLLYDVMRRQHESLTRTLALLNNSGVESAMRQMERQQAELRRALDHSFSPQLTEISRATQQLYELSLPTTLHPNVFEQAHSSWFSSIPSIELDRVVKMALTDISCDLSVTQRLLASFDYDFLGRHLDIQLSTMSEVQRSMSDLWASFDRLASSMPSLEDIVQLPSFILPGATYELTMTSHALDVLYPMEHRADTEVIELGPYPLDEEETGATDLIVLLERIDPQFAAMYRGAMEALESDNPDRSRHVLTSLRELWNHLLRKLAPKEDVMEWINEHGSQGYLHDGQPTRHAKIRYALRALEDEPLEDFIEADTKAIVQLYKLYGRLHRLDTGLSDEQLRVITFRTESCLDYILRIREWLIE